MQPVNSLIVYDVTLEIQRAKVTREIVRHLRQDVLTPGIDYGPQPGAGKVKDPRTGEEKEKDVLKKPGAEKLCNTFHLNPEFEPVGKVEQWDSEKPLFNYQYRCRLIHIETGLCVATGIGSCNSMESKYRWRNAERVCPNCGKPAIIKGKAEYGGGWVCFDKKGGCKSKFPDDDPQIVEQRTGKVENKDIFDLVNTVDKMAQKRALIAATLIGCSASEFFTQDLDDIKPYSDDVIDAEVIDAEPPAQQTPAEPPKQQPKNGNGHQAWYTHPDNIKIVRDWLAQRELTMDAAVKLVGKPLTEFTTGNDFTVAVTAAIGKPATPKNPQTNGKEELPPPSWYDQAGDLANFAAFLEGFEMTAFIAKQKTKVSDWRTFKTRQEAQEHVRKIAFQEAWPMKALACKYEPQENGSSRITFETPLPVVWFAGRHELIEAVSEAQADWQEILKWEKPGNCILPEPVQIEVAVKDDHLEIAHIVSAVGIPF